MKIKLKSLYITDYDPNDKRKQRFIEDVCSDLLVCNFISFKMKDSFKLVSNYDNNLDIGPSYIIGDDRKLVGFIRLIKSNSEVIDLHYGVNPNYRHNGYGTKILIEVGDYIFKNIDYINKIKLSIESINKNSVKCAIKAGYNYEYAVDYNNRDSKVLVYTKTRKNKQR